MITEAKIYNSSSGPKFIPEMNHFNVVKAHAKLLRDEPHRANEIDDLAAQIASNEAAFAADQDAPLADQSIGANHPPEPIEAVAAATPVEVAADPFEAHRVNIDDLYTEAKAWCDGTDIANEAQAAEVDRLIALFKEVRDAANASREATTKPLQDKVKAIQEQYWTLTGDTTKVKGIATRAITALLAVKTKWANALQAQRDAEAKRLRDQAAAKAAQAVAAAREAVGNIEATEKAEDLIQAAQATLKAATQAEKPAVKGMRDSWVIAGFSQTTDDEGVTVDGRGLLIRFYLKRRPEDIVQACLELAREDVRNGIRTIPGLVIENQRRAV